MKIINVLALNELLHNEAEKIQVIDVRETYEREICQLENALHIPLNRIPDKTDLINKEGKVAILCRSGVRSARAVEFLENNFQLDNLYNIEGGILAWADEIDTSMEKY